MTNQPVQKPKRGVPWILGALLLISLTLLILLQSSNLWKDFSVETASDTLLLYALSSLNFIAFIIFGFIFLRSIIKLVRERRTLELGAKIKTRLLLYFFAISLLPIIAMAVFSYLFMNRALERWFTQIPENVVREAREVQTKATTDRAAKLGETAQMLASVLEKREFTRQDLEAIMRAGNLTRVEVVSRDNKTLELSEKALSGEQKAELEKTLDFVRNGQPGEAALQDGKGFDVAMVNLTDGRKLILVPGFQSEQSVSQIVDKSLLEFDRLKDKQITVRQIGFLTLGILTFLLIFASSWLAFYIARGLTLPIKALAEGAGEIARGNLAHRVTIFAEDELALLVSAFNQMSSKLEENSAELSERRKYIETVLQSLPTGIISFDGENRVTTINKAAVNILEMEDSNLAEFRLETLVSDENRVVLERLLSRAKRIGHASEQTVLQRERTDGSPPTDANLPVALTATGLPSENGVVLVIEDLSELITAQRAAAWQEVARRMAHEIKNPLTPIQLSAERIARRFDYPVTPGNGDTGTPIGEFDSGDDQTAAVVRDGTETILREVYSLKSMVDEFSRFARLPDPKPESGNLNQIIGQVSALYEDRSREIKIELDLASHLPEVLIDTEQFKRVFVNLFENSIEAFDDSGPEKQIVIKTRHDAARDLIVAEVSDNGKGIRPSDFQKLFQPYFSTKGRGTGLGLAIVQRIISEHHGKIKVVSNQPKGAKFIIELPVVG